MRTYCCMPSQMRCWAPRHWAILENFFRTVISAFAGADSLRLLESVVLLLKKEGYRVGKY